MWVNGKTGTKILERNGLQELKRIYDTTQKMPFRLCAFFSFTFPSSGSIIREPNAATNGTRGNGGWELAFGRNTPIEISGRVRCHKERPNYSRKSRQHTWEPICFRGNLCFWPRWRVYIFQSQKICINS